MRGKRYKRFQRRVRFLVFSITVLLVIGVLYFTGAFEAGGQNNVVETAGLNVTKEPDKSVDSNVTKEPDKIANPDATKKPAETAGTMETQKPSVSSSKKPEQNNSGIHLAFVGDILLSDGVLNQFDQKGINGVVSKTVLASLQNADITMANEEFPFGTTGAKMEDKQFTFRISPKRVPILKQLGIDLVTLANNHAMDYGREALLSSFETLDGAGITYVGAGKNLNEAKQIRYKSVNHIKLAYIAASRVIPEAGWNAGADLPGMLTAYDPTIVLEQIKTAEQNADFTIVYLHWGIERKDKPESYQRELAKKFIEAGADLVIGSHPHCLQGIEYYKHKPIVYSLGNFIFGTTISKTAVLNVALDKTLNPQLSVIPCEGTNFFTKEILDTNKRTNFYNYLQDISFQVLIDKNGMIQERNTVEKLN